MRNIKNSHTQEIPVNSALVYKSNSNGIYLFVLRYEENSAFRIGIHTASGPKVSLADLILEHANNEKLTKYTIPISRINTIISHEYILLYKTKADNFIERLKLNTMLHLPFVELFDAVSEDIPDEIPLVLL
jgi:hypothetical protein